MEGASRVARAGDPLRTIKDVKGDHEMSTEGFLSRQLKSRFRTNDLSSIDHDVVAFPSDASLNVGSV